MSMAATTAQTEPAAAAFDPRITAFVCKWCTYAGADLAGTSRMVYPSNVRTIMLPCTGRIDVSFVLRAFLQGADGVIVSGCHPGDCHYTAGNYRARRRWILFRDLLDTLGVDLRRFEVAWISAAEGAKWVKTITQFTDHIRALGAHASMREVAGRRTVPLAPPADSDTSASPAAVTAGAVSEATADAGPDPVLIEAVTQALTENTVKAVIGWSRSQTLRLARPAWITSPDAAAEIAHAAGSANLARLFKNPRLRSVTPIGIVARACEMLALNVLIQEAQIDPRQVLVFAVDAAGRFIGTLDAAAASAKLLDATVTQLPSGQPVGFSAATFRQLDELMAAPPAQRWEFWKTQSSKCVKCYACRQSCPMCNCEQCFTERNQPQWFPTAADGPGNFSWHVMRAFHLSGRCVGCGACEAACPTQIPLNLLSAAMARSAMKHFGHRAGLDPLAPPLQSDFKPDDNEDFIL